MNETKQMTLAILRIDEKARAHEWELVYKVHLALGLPTDLKELAQGSGEFTAGTISRYRRMFQAEYPELRPTEEITARRRAKQERMEEEMRNRK